MAFNCPRCDGHATLKINQTLELPPDARWDEITMQSISCRVCGFAGIAIYEESRHGALDSEIVHHTGYLTTEADTVAIRALLANCPDPGRALCPCPTHRELGSIDPMTTRWLQPSAITNARAFPMILSSSGLE